jgi:osmotically-inducible protein OsmY
VRTALRERHAGRHAARACALVVLAMLTVAAPPGARAQAPTPSRADSVLAVRVDTAIRAASDVPADSIRVEVSEGVVSLTGSVVCDECGGTSTPGGTGTVQQSLGAVVRAVPGVREVRFYLRYRPR